ncbi:hypothetical protein AJ79_02446 [Helicocarpus griseus UAMH5409]|uniref:Uncharacterized protein n=1 Tax=Helicocarpus griseus UAMH5409 TaxID=1447875 RepID=A0A2B7Y2V7_9EURO|nr:hypothetical protein AJ79_02446 [Helicocarpus griseus UAMH5409]
MSPLHVAQRTYRYLCKDSCLIRRAPYQAIPHPLVTVSGRKCYEARRCASTTTTAVPHLVAHDLNDSQQPPHVQTVSAELSQHGLLKISLKFPDSNSQYLHQLLYSLRANHGHGLPITHSASRGWFWDVRPSRDSFQTENHQARSKPCNSSPGIQTAATKRHPRDFFALHVLQHDRPEYRIAIPPEFIKTADRRHTIGGLLIHGDHGQCTRMRFREDIVTPLSTGAANALEELKEALRSLDATASSSALHLSAQDLPSQSIILIDNSRWLHARNDIKDPERHLRRVRWHAIRFST